MCFVNLHGHSHYSLLDGFGSPEEIVLRAKQLGYPAAALTDHGVTYGLMELYNAGRQHNVKPILGCEFYVATRTRFDKEAKVDVKPYHLTVLAKNQTGYQNLLRLVTKAHLEGFYYKPRVDYGLLKAYGDGLIVLSGCLAAHLPRLILAGRDDDADALVKLHIEIFGKENYFLEIQDNPLIENQKIVNERLRVLAKKFGLEMVLTFDSHYPRPEDSDAHDILLCIQTQTNVNDQNRMRYPGDFSLRDVTELREVYSDFPDVFENSLRIAERCNVEFDFGKNLIPSFKTPQNEKAYDYLRKLCLDGLANRFSGKKIPQEYLDRLDFELNTVNKMGFDTYFLIVHDFVKFAKESQIVVGPGRGSAAGSILAWSLKITDLDPIEYGLFFERFLNPERVSMPDIDIDFADIRRAEVLNYVFDKYGKDNVAQIITFGTMAPKAAVRDVGRALGYPYHEVDQLAKTVPAPILGKHAPLKESVVEDAALRDEYQKNPRYKVLLDYAMKLEGTVRHAGTHACAVVISEKPLTDYTAIQFAAGGSNEIITQYSAKPLEDLGLLKMDFLGLRNLTIIQKTQDFLLKNQEMRIDVDNLPLADLKTFELLQKADTTGVFQLESPGMRRYLKQLKPTKFEDIVAMGALYRPGPMEWIPDYIKGKHNPEKVNYLHESFKEILEPTYGVAVYQEQILQIARDFAGFSLGEADILRKAVGKKIPSLLAEQREKFVSGAIKNGHKESFAKQVFENVIEPFAGYGFNKAHAVCYGMIAYQTAYLKAHFPLEFMTALLCADAGNMDRIALEIKECGEMGIEILAPSINESFANFTSVGKKSIRFGLLAVKGVGEGPINQIIEARQKGEKFQSLEDFAKRVPSQILNKKLVTALAYSGAFDEFGERNQIAENHEQISKYGKQIQTVCHDGQIDLFGSLEHDFTDAAGLKFHEASKLSNFERLRYEKEFLGLYVSGHPLRGLKKYISKKAHLIGNLDKKSVGKNLKILGLVSGVKKIVTKTGGYMATFVIEDPSGKINAVIFPKSMQQYGSQLVEDSIVGVNGKLDFRRGQYQLLCDTAKVLALETMLENAKESKLFDSKDTGIFAVRFLDDILGSDNEVVDDSSDVTYAGHPADGAFLINIPENAEASLMSALKNLLMQHKGETLVSLYLPSARKKIKLPFGINLSEELKESVSQLLKA